MDTTRQLNPFEIKSEITKLISEFTNVNDLSKYIDKIQLLDAQTDKKTISKLLFKELYNVKTDDASIICFLLERYADKDELTKKLWDLLKNNVAPNNVKIIAVNFLRGLDSNWELDTGDELLNAEIIDKETEKLLDSAIINPEVQIDFLDFMSSLSSSDKITLIKSLSNDYSEDALANILIPVFLSQPDSEVGIEALKILGESKSELAYHALSTATVNEKILPILKKSLSTLKIAGIRGDDSHDFYKKVLAESVPYKSCTTYPDGHGNQAVIFTRKTQQDKIRFVAIVIDDYHGIRDCFGFNEISQFECDKIIERFYKNETEINLTPKQLKSVLVYAENISSQNSNNWLLPYEYVCWKNLLSDIEHEDIKTALNSIVVKELNTKDMETIYGMGFMQKWFLDANYSDEFEAFISREYDDLEKAVDKNVDLIFFDAEKSIWSERLLMCAYLELTQGNTDSAVLLYSLYHDKNKKQELFKNIIRKSIYEYYVSLKYNTELNNGRFSLNELDTIIGKIEDLWVCTK